MTWRDTCSGPASHTAATAVAATTRCLESATCYARCSAVAGCTRAPAAKLKVLAGSPSHGRSGASGPPGPRRLQVHVLRTRGPVSLLAGDRGSLGTWRRRFLRPRPLPLCAQPAAGLPFRACPSAPSPLPDVPRHPMSPHTRCPPTPV